MKVLIPPYAETEPCSLCDLPRPGGIVFLPPASLNELSLASLLDMRRQLSWATVAICLPPTSSPAELAWGFQALFVQAVSAVSEELVTPRHLLPPARHISSYIAGWLAVAAALDPEQRSLVASVLGVDGRPQSHIGKRPCNQALRLRRRAACLGLPPPRALWALRRGVQVLREIMSYPVTAFAPVAAEAGFHDAASMSRAIHNLFGVRPTGARHLLSLDWFLHLWLARHWKTQT